MDRFYLENANLYCKLVDALDVTASATHFSRQKSTSAVNDPDAPTTTAEPQRRDSAMVVSARIRPMLADDIAAGFPCATFPRAKYSGASSTLDLHDLYNSPRGRPVLKSSKYDVDRLYDSTTNTDDIFEDLVIDLIAFAQHGGIGTLFAYGQTGSGKTFTISELQKLTAVWLIDDKTTHKDMEISITVVDLAGDSAFDLLDGRKPIQVLEDASGETQLAGAKEHLVNDVDELLGLLDHAASFRRTASTLKNDNSSRSHSICRIRIRRPDNTHDGLLYLVDLAGSEAARDVTEHGADRMREARQINISLSVLKDCVRGKAEAEAAKRRGKQKKIHVPIRRSMLTRILKHVFDPEDKKLSKTVVVACVNPSLADVNSSKNTLRYAEMLKVPGT